MAQKDLWNLAKEKIMKGRGELPNEEGDAVREYKALHGENFLSSWLRENERGEEERTAKVENNAEERSEKRKRRRRNKRTTREELSEDVKVLVRWRLFEIFSQGRELG